MFFLDLFCSFLLEFQFKFDNNTFVFMQNSPPRAGTVELVLIEARDLIAADLRGTSDPYVRVHYGNLKKRTKVGCCFIFS